jgi:3D (Asp-Asp-Asp) domain-containing protein
VKRAAIFPIQRRSFVTLLYWVRFMCFWVVLPTLDEVALQNNPGAHVRGLFSDCWQRLPYNAIHYIQNNTSVYITLHDTASTVMNVHVQVHVQVQARVHAQIQVQVQVKVHARCSTLHYYITVPYIIVPYTFCRLRAIHTNSIAV